MQARSKGKMVLMYTAAALKQHFYRIVVLAIVFAFSFVSLFGPLLQISNGGQTQLSDATKRLVGGTRDDAAEYLKYDSKTGSYSFAAPEQDKSTAYQHTGRNADAYSATLPKKAGDGVTVTESASKISVTLTPQFFTTSARKTDDNNIVYQSGNRQLVYTLKYNGLKEDIVIPEFNGETQRFSFRLSLPSGVEARKLDDGSIGIYSSDPTLFGNISFGSDEDRAKVDKARENSEKTNLVMSIPFPLIKDATGQEYSDRSSFELGDHKLEKRSDKQAGLPDDAPASLGTFNTYMLTVKAWNLKQLTYPIAIDPTMQVTSSADFGKLNPESGTEIETSSNVIKRANLTGGTLTSWSTEVTDTPTTGTGHAVAYNGFMYWFAGSAPMNSYYAPINSNDGTIGGFTQTSSIGTISSLSVSVYNGYVYALGGQTGGSRYAFYAKINTDGSLGAFNSTSLYTTGRAAFATTAYNGYLYISGGYYVAQDGGGACPPVCIDQNHYMTDVQKAPINGDGSLGTWSSAGNNFTNGRSGHEMPIYNNRIYVVGGYNDNLPALPQEVRYATIDTSTHNVGTWTATSSTLNSNVDFLAQVINGYMYAGLGVSGQSTIQYAPINADGSLGAWRQASDMGNVRAHIGHVAYNGYIYALGGNGCNASCGTEYDDIFKAQVNPAGTVGTFADSGNNFTAARYGHGTAVYNGYIFIVGGCSTNGCTDSDGTTGYLATAYSAQIQSDGTLGAWNTSSASLPASGATKAGRLNVALAVYNTRLYVTGGLARNSIGSGASYKSDALYGTISNTGVISSWSSATGAFAASRFRHSAIADQGHLYIVGGHANDQYQEGVLLGSDQVQIGAIDFDGDIASFSDGPQLNTGRITHKSVIAHGYIYVIGGYNHPDYLNSIERAEINSDGTLDAWTSTGNTAFTNARRDLGAYMNKNKLYITAGNNGSTFYNDIQSADIADDGTIGAWTTNSNTFTTARYSAGTVIYNDFVYVVGGCSAGTNDGGGGCTARLNTTQYAQINNGGSGKVATWTNTNQSAQRTGAATVMINGRIYAFGGCNDSFCGASVNYLSTSEYTTINADGTLAAWVSGPNINAARTYMRATVLGSYVYLTGGTNSGGSNIQTVEYAKINSDGSLASDADGAGGCSTTWCATTSLPASLSRHTAAAYDGYLYVISGYYGGAPTTAVRSIQQNTSDGSLTGSWTATANSLNLVRYSHGGDVYKNKVYVFGGFTDDPNAMTTEYATLQSGGTVSTWKISSSILRQHRHNAAVIYNGFAYVIAGMTTGGTAITTAERAPVLSDGSLGQWEYITSITTARYFATALASNGNLYILGGSGTTNRAQYVGAQSIPRIGYASRMYDFGSGVRPTKLITRGTKQTSSTTALQYMNSNNAGTTFGSRTTASDIGYAGTSTRTIGLGTNITLSQYLFLRYTIDDSMSAVFPDEDNESYITDFDLYFTANPAKRLRGGRTFIDGQDRGLDTSPQ